MPIDPHLFQLYLVAATVLVLIPGPDTLLVLGRSLFEGRRAG
jgi:threonine/homoserine/homoserine lactone efflux protein